MCSVGFVSVATDSAVLCSVGFVSFATDSVVVLDERLCWFCVAFDRNCVVM